MVQNKAKILKNFESFDSPLRKSSKKTNNENVERFLKFLISNCFNLGVAIN